MGSGLSSYEPNPALAWIYQRFFEHIEVDQAWAKQVREAESRGTVIYVLRNLSFVDFLALDYLTKKERLPRVRFANDLGLLSEEYDTVARRLTGNFPQALTHIALVNTIHNLSAARKPAVQRAKS